MTFSLEAAKAPGKSRAIKIFALVIALFVVLGVVATGGSFAYAKQFEGKALPGTTVMGVDVSGKSASEIASIVAKKGTGTKATVNAQGSTTQVPFEDLGITIDPRATAAKALERENSVASVVSSSLSGETSISPVVAVDKKKAEAYARSLVPTDQAQPVNAEVVQDEKSRELTVKEGRPGQGVDPSQFVATVEKHASSLKPFTVDLSFTQIEPALTTKEAQDAVSAVDKLTGTTITVKGPEGKTFDVSKKDRLHFITVKPNDAGDNFEVAIDQGEIDEYLDSMAGEIESSDKVGVTEVLPDGKKRVVSEPEDGLKITNKKDVSTQVTDAIKGGKDLSVSYTTEVIKAEVQEKKIEAPKPEDKPEQKPGQMPAPKAPEKAPAPKPALPSWAPEEAHNGERWIDVNLSKKTVTAYQGDQIVYGPIKIVDGKVGHETVTGEYRIWHRTEVQDMGCTPKYDYCTKDVRYNQFFYKGYALHSAPWRSTFGYSGSHGCINMTVKDAKWMFNWASIGTKVVSHR